MGTRFLKGSKLVWKNTGQPAFEKLDDNEWGYWVSLDSRFTVTEKRLNSETNEMETVYVSYPESQKPLHNGEGRLNRYGFKWTDEQVFEHYNSFMNFEYAAVD
jgi:hypothetical protein